MHRGTFRHQGTVADLTRTLPSSIRFSLAPGAQAPPIGSPGADGLSYTIETFELQADLTALLNWAAARGVELRDLSAARTRLDDVFRAIEADPAPTPTR
jgi:ABC-2 type transport system ATP-binding protein